MDRNLGKYICDHGDTGKISGTRPVESSFQELRHGENIGSQIERDEDPAQYEQHETGQPFEVTDRQSR